MEMAGIVPPKVLIESTGLILYVSQDSHLLFPIRLADKASGRWPSAFVRADLRRRQFLYNLAEKGPGSAPHF
jgi:hypothetical protein